MLGSTSPVNKNETTDMIAPNTQQNNLSAALARRDGAAGGSGLLADSGLPPLGNTGVNSHLERFQMRIHWLSGSFNFGGRAEIELLIQKFSDLFFLPFSFSGSITRGKKYLHSAIFPSGVIFAYNLPTDIKVGEAWLSIPGSVFDSWDTNYLILLFHFLFEFPELESFRCTRLDLAIDDFSKSVSPAFLYEIAQKGDFSGFRHSPIFSNGRWLPPSYKFISSPSVLPDGTVISSNTLVFGSSQSDKQLIIYDKYLESAGICDSIRFEARFKDGFAASRLALLYEKIHDSDSIGFFHLIGSMVTGSIDFVVRTGDKNLNRLQRYQFWIDFINHLGRVKVPAPKPLRTLEDTIIWMFRSWRRTLAILHQVCGFEELFTSLNDLMFVGLDSLSSQHHAIIKNCKLLGFSVDKILQTCYY